MDALTVLDNMEIMAKALLGVNPEYKGLLSFDSISCELQSRAAKIAFADFAMEQMRKRAVINGKGTTP